MDAHDMLKRWFCVAALFTLFSVASASFVYASDGSCCDFIGDYCISEPPEHEHEADYPYNATQEEFVSCCKHSRGSGCCLLAYFSMGEGNTGIFEDLYLDILYNDPLNLRDIHYSIFKPPKMQAKHRLFLHCE